MQVKNYKLVKVSIPEEKYELAFAYTHDLPFSGIEERLDEIIYTFDDQIFSNEILKELERSLKLLGSDVNIETIDDLSEKNWNEEWEKNVKIINVDNDIGIAPSWKIDELNTAIKIIINPRMSFGTGEHATTRLVCRLMKNFDIHYKKVIDIGTGTGILAILAKILGANDVFAFDNSQWSVENSIKNAELNGLKKQIRFELIDLDGYSLPPADIILANLFTNLHLNNFAKYSGSLDQGILLVSGIMKYDEDKIISKAIQNDFSVYEKAYEDEWVAITLGKLYEICFY